MDMLKDSYETLDHFFDLRRGWDNDGAERICSTSVENAKRFLENYVNHTSDIPQIFPDSSGGVRFVWEGQNQCVEMTFLVNGDINLYTEYFRPERIKERNFARVSTVVDRLRKHFSALPLIPA